ncbi:hypothetical protein [Helcococcus kunzii]|uniref:hypothetical protein n=1 Tax=Helcococcus kunzii TaxID=40091 RepID=UPI0024ACE201|nr:hypothetical protein [Helcococcus kunzii]
MSKNEIYIFATVNLLNLFIVFMIYKISRDRDKIRIHVKNRLITNVFIVLFFVIYLAIIWDRFTNIYILGSLIVMLVLTVYMNLIAPYIVGIGDEFIYYSNNRSYGSFPVRKIRIDNLKNVKLTIKREKDYVKLEVLRTQLYQIYSLEDLQGIKKVLDGKIYKIEDRSK